VKVAALTGALVALALAGPAAARAGTYTVTACDDAPGHANNAWRAQVTAGTLSASQSCPSSGDLSGLLTADVPDAGDTPAGTRAEWVFDAPPGTTISQAHVSYELQNWLDPGWQAYLRDGNGDVVTCGSDCGIGSWPPGPDGLWPVSTNELAVGVACNAATTCLNGVSGHHNAMATIFGIGVTLTDPTPPILAAPSGGLWTTPGWLRGQQVLGVQASDQQSGIALLALDVDGVRQQAAGQPCDYTRAIPCSVSASTAWSLDTRQLSDGAHTVAVVAEDATAQEAAPNTTTVVHVIHVDNTAPAAPPSLRIGGPVATGKPFSANWTLPGQGTGSPIASATWRLCPSARGDACESGLVSGADQTTATGLRVTSGGRWSLSVSLTDAAGNVGAGTVQAVIDTTAPAAPRALHASRRGRSVTLSWRLPVQPAPRAPIATARYAICPTDGRCLRGSARAAGPLRIRLPRRGHWGISVWLADAAGNANPDNSASALMTWPRIAVALRASRVRVRGGVLEATGWCSLARIRLTVVRSGVIIGRIGTDAHGLWRVRSHADKVAIEYRGDTTHAPARLLLRARSDT
jgi:hypothetical protein